MHNARDQPGDAAIIDVLLQHTAEQLEALARHAKPL
jgi:hypothetical protein